MKNPIPTLIMAFVVIVMAVWWTAANAQVLGWLLIATDFRNQDMLVVDTFMDEDSCLAERDTIVSQVQDMQGIVLSCTPVRPS